MSKAVRFDEYGGIEVLAGCAAARAVPAAAGEAVVLAGSGGGVGVFAVQLAVRPGARVIAVASERRHAWLRERGAVPVAYGDGVSERITAAAEETPVAAFIALVGGGYVELALELGIAKDRIDTIVDFPATQKYGVKFEGGAAAASAATLAELAAAVAAGGGRGPPPPPPPPPGGRGAAPPPAAPPPAGGGGPPPPPRASL